MKKEDLLQKKDVVEQKPQKFSIRIEMTEEQHQELLDEMKKAGYTVQSLFIKDAIQFYSDHFDKTGNLHEKSLDDISAENEEIKNKLNTLQLILTALWSKSGYDYPVPDKYLTDLIIQSQRYSDKNDVGASGLRKSSNDSVAVKRQFLEERKKK